MAMIVTVPYVKPMVVDPHPDPIVAMMVDGEMQSVTWDGQNYVAGVPMGTVDIEVPDYFNAWERDARITYLRERMPK